MQDWKYHHHHHLLLCHFYYWPNKKLNKQCVEFQSFESKETREDYYTVCAWVLKEVWSGLVLLPAYVPGFLEVYILVLEANYL